MPIKVICPGCKKSIKAKDSLAGKRVKCPGCKTALQIPALASATDDAEHSPTNREQQVQLAGEAAARAMFAAVEGKQWRDAASYLQAIELIMISVSEEEQGMQPMIVEVNGQDAVVAFTSNDCLADFADQIPEIVEPDGSIDGFAMSGPEAFEPFEGDLALFINPASEPLMLDPESIGEIQKHLQDPTLAMPQVNIGATASAELANAELANADPLAMKIRQRGMEKLHSKEFRPAEWLPMPDVTRQLRPASEIAGKLFALAAEFAWVSAPEEALPSAVLQDFVNTNNLSDVFSAEQKTLFKLSRQDAMQQHGESVGWRLENMWPLAWVLGFNKQPVVAASQIPEEVTQGIVFEFLGSFALQIDSLLAEHKTQPKKAVMQLEDYFYCAHNAVRSAQVDPASSTVPDGFHPVVHGGAVHERRHSLTWCLSPGVAWEETDLST